MLVFPNFLSAGLAVGCSYGKGELLVNGRRGQPQMDGSKVTPLPL